MPHVVMKHQGVVDLQQLASVAIAADLSQRPGPVLKFDLGHMTATDVMLAAKADPQKQQWQVCEANYFIGEDELSHHRQTNAVMRFRAARDRCSKNDAIYDAAIMELKRVSGRPHIGSKQCSRKARCTQASITILPFVPIPMNLYS